MRRHAASQRWIAGLVQFRWDFFELAGDVCEWIARHSGATIEASSGVLLKYRKTPMPAAPGYWLASRFHLKSQPPIELFPYSLQESNVAIFALGISPAN
jgi:hypothetical protein